MFYWIWNTGSDKNKLQKGASSGIDIISSDLLVNHLLI